MPTATATAAPSPEPELTPELAAPGEALPGLDLTALLPERSAQDILAGQIHVRLGGERYTLRVLPIKANREWKERLEDRLSNLLGMLDASGDSLEAVMAAFATATPQLIEALYGYDVDHVLPPVEALEEVATDTEVLRAVLEVWSAANPFATVALSTMRQAGAALPTPGRRANGSSPHTSGSPRPTAGTRKRSRSS